jgi:hypothetical protein
MSKRFAMKRYLGLTQEEITENERLWKEENTGKLTASNDAASQMRSVGVTPGNVQADMTDQTAEAPEDMAAAAEAPGGAETAEAPPPQ